MTEGNGVLPTVKYSLAMIVRDCASDLDRCLKSFSVYPDEIVIVNTGLNEDEPGFKETNAVAASHGAKVFHFPWIEDFSAARNFSFSKCSHDIVMWLDSDDTVENPKILNECIRKCFATGEIEALYTEYLYEFDEKGVCTSVLTRERVVNRRCYEWRAPIHEVLCENYRVRADKIPPHMARIRHHHVRDDAGQQKSLARNLRVLEHHYLPKEQGGLGEFCEERMLFYFAQTYMGLGRLNDALKKYLEYVPRSGSEGEIMMALGHASECARLMKLFPQARALAYQAIERGPDSPSPYWFAALANYQGGNDKLAAHYAVLCLERAKNFATEMVVNPKVMFGGSALLAATAYYRMNRIDEIEPLLDIATKHYGPDDAQIVEMRKNVALARRRAQLLGSYENLINVALHEGRHDDVRAIARSAPPEIKDNPIVARYLPKIRPAGKRSMVIMAGGGMPGGWGPELIKTGIGGSEEAVCYLAEEFVRKGWHVEVYANCKRQTWKGVEWYPFAEFSGNDDLQIVDVAIVWRTSWMMLDCGIKARRTYLWLHDMPNTGWWLDGIWNGFDGIFVLSDFHQKQYDFVPKEKFIQSANGIPLGILPPIDQLQNEPHRLVYASCPTRGLEIALKWWNYIKEQVPDAEFDIYYGFHPTFMAQVNDKTPLGKAHAHIYKTIEELRQQPGVNWKGFVGHEELHSGLARAGVWGYPCVFPEIHCITGVKMQALGVVPVTVNKFALAETVKHGVKLDVDIDTVEGQKVWADAVIAQMKNPWTQEQRACMAIDVRGWAGWDKIVEQWAGIFETHLKEPRPDRIYARKRMDLIRASV